MLTFKKPQPSPGFPQKPKPSAMAAAKVADAFSQLSPPLGPSPSPKGPSAQILGFQGPKTTQSMDFGTYKTLLFGYSDPLGIVLSQEEPSQLGGSLMKVW